MASEQAEAVDLVASDTVKQLSGAVLFAALTGVLAQFSIPLGGVPFSFHVFVVFLAGLILGPLWGGFSLLLYFLVGLAGAPVFANGGAGIAYVAGPTGGFLIGFILAAILIGLITHRSINTRPITELSPVLNVTGLIGGLIIIYLFGLPWYAAVTNPEFGLKNIGNSAVILAKTASGFGLLMIFDLIKVGLTVGIISKVDEFVVDLNDLSQ